ncbi:MAG: hypothetical protein EOR00_18295 [Mesorhizobium sp.]|nr:MAG: hypothetical protein EOR00_18295 [Mesorhizobium sp.]
MARLESNNVVRMVHAVTIEGHGGGGPLSLEEEVERGNVRGLTFGKPLALHPGDDRLRFIRRSRFGREAEQMRFEDMRHGEVGGEFDGAVQ